MINGEENINRSMKEGTRIETPIFRETAKKKWDNRTNKTFYLGDSDNKRLVLLTVIRSLRLGRKDRAK